VKTVRQVFQDSGDGWKALDCLQKCKEGTLGFDYRVNKDRDGRPTAIVWITNSMRKAWIRFGSTIFLNAMKRKLNSIHWPYIGPLALDQENRVVLLYECLCLVEELDAYAFVLNSLEEMEPRRKKSTIRIIFADCFITDELLPMVGLERALKPLLCGTHFTSSLRYGPNNLGSIHLTCWTRTLRL
jgi:hypothetical protein